MAQLLDDEFLPTAFYVQHQPSEKGNGSRRRIVHYLSDGYFLIARNKNAIPSYHQYINIKVLIVIGSR